MKLSLKVSVFPLKTRLMYEHNDSDKVSMKSENRSFSEILSTLLQTESQQSDDSIPRNTAPTTGRITAWWQIEKPQNTVFRKKAHYPSSNSKPLKPPPPPQAKPAPEPLRPSKTYDLTQLSKSQLSLAQSFFKLAGREWNSKVTESELKSMYRGLAKKYHPDTHKEPSSERTALFREIKNNYQVLLKALKRL